MSLTADQLAEMRRAAQSLLNQTCDIARPARTPDGMGGWTESLTPIASDVACRLAVRRGIALGGQRAERAERLTSIYESTLKLAYDADIAPGDHVTIAGQTYIVESLLNEHQWATLARCRVTRLA